MAVSQLNDYTFETITTDIDFSTSSSEDVVIAITKPIREVVRGRLYIDSDPGAFAAWATYTFYNKAAKRGEDAFYRTAAKMVYTECEVAPSGTTSLQLDDQTDLSPNDLVYIMDGANSEFVRLKTIANICIAEDILASHDIDDGVSRVSEFSGFRLFNNEGGTNVYLRIAFAVAQTVSLKMELMVR